MAVRPFAHALLGEFGQRGDGPDGDEDVAFVQDGVPSRRDDQLAAGFFTASTMSPSYGSHTSRRERDTSREPWPTTSSSTRRSEAMLTMSANSKTAGLRAREAMRAPLTT